MSRKLVDSTNIQDDPLDAQLVAYYCDGIYAVSEATVRARFPNAILVPISAIGTNAGIVGDQEPGCMSIEQAVAWVQERRAASLDPTIYVNETYGWAGARQAFDAYGVPEPHWWVADYDGIAVIPPGAVAKQYENPTLTHGHFDLSVAADFWPGVDPVIPKRRPISLATVKSLHEFCQGTDLALWHRKRTGGIWTPWSSLGGRVTTDISAGVDDQGTIILTVMGTYSDGTANGTYYDSLSHDDGVTWSAWVDSGGRGKGLIVLSALPTSATGVDLTPIEASLGALSAHLGVGKP